MLCFWNWMPFPVPSIAQGEMLLMFVTTLPVRLSCQTQLRPQLLPPFGRSPVHTMLLTPG
jgi:hypothetical protein